MTRLIALPTPKRPPSVTPSNLHLDWGQEVPGIAERSLLRKGFVSIERRATIATAVAREVEKRMQIAGCAIRVQVSRDTSGRRKRQVGWANFHLTLGRHVPTPHGDDDPRMNPVMTFAWSKVSWDGHFMHGHVQPRHQAELAVFEAAIGPALQRVCARNRFGIEVPPLWVVDALSLSDCHLLTAQHVLHLRGFPRIGETFYFAGRRLEVVDGAEYATHSYPAEADGGAP